MSVRPWLSMLGASAREEWSRIFRERSILLVLLAIPVLYPVIVAYLYHADEARDRPALLLDLDGSALSRRVALDLEATPEIGIAGRVGSVDEGLAALRADRAELLVVIPADFSRDLKRGRPAQLAVWSGGANLYAWGIAFPAVHGVAGTLDAQLAARAFLARGLPPAAARSRAAPIATGERLLYHPTGSYGRYLAVGVFLVVIQQLVVISLAFSAGVRRERGLAVAAPPYPFAKLLGMAGAHAPFWLAGVGFVVLAVLPAMGWSGPSTLAVLALFLLFTATLVPVAIALASLARDRMGAFQLLMFFSVPLFLASGYTWPPGQLPWLVEAVTAPFPATPALRALRILSMKTGELRAVAPQLAWLAGELVAYALLAVVVVRRSWRRLPGFPWGLRLGAPPATGASPEATP